MISPTSPRCFQVSVGYAHVFDQADAYLDTIWLDRNEAVVVLAGPSHPIAAIIEDVRLLGSHVDDVTSQSELSVMKRRGRDEMGIFETKVGLALQRVAGSWSGLRGVDLASCITFVQIRVRVVQMRPASAYVRLSYTFQHGQDAASGFCVLCFGWLANSDFASCQP